MCEKEFCNIAKLVLNQHGKSIGPVHILLNIWRYMIRGTMKWAHI